MGSITAYGLAVVVGVILPALTALVTKRAAPDAVKAVVLLALAAVTGFVQAWQAAESNGTVFDWRTVGAATVVSFVTAVAAHFGLLRPVGVTGQDGVIARAVPGGIGPSRRPVVSVADGDPAGRSPGLYE